MNSNRRAVLFFCSRRKLRGGTANPSRYGQSTCGVEDVAQVVDPQTGVLGQQAEVRNHKLPYAIRNIAGVRLVSDHTLNYISSWTKVRNTL